jgi:hypothetical protein
MKSFEEFLDGFAATANLKRSEADEQWAGFSYQLSDRERDRIERGGFDSGESEGKKFAAMFGEEAESQWSVAAHRLRVSRREYKDHCEKVGKTYPGDAMFEEIYKLGVFDTGLVDLHNCVFVGLRSKRQKGGEAE